MWLSNNGKKKERRAVAVAIHDTSTGMAGMIHHHDHALDLDIDLLLHLHLLTLPRDITIESHTKKEEEIVARHLKEEESINPSLDQDLDQDTDRLHTIDKGVKEGIRDRQDPQGNIDVQHHCHIHYPKKAFTFQNKIPKEI